jgi:photosystem II stability/assembly factor-like uncharacterized protein
MRRSVPLLLTLSVGLATIVPVAARQAPAIDLTGVGSALHWRNIGPTRGGRTKAAAGIPSQPNVFLIGAVNGGVWKTTDYGRTWTPIFDGQPTGSIGAIAIAPSNPDIIYVGSGEGLHRPDLSTGMGMFKSIDGGKSWTHLGLRDSQQIPQVIVDPVNPNRLFVAALGHPYGPNEERGIFRSLDGGLTFQKVLYKDENTGGVDLAFDPSNTNTVYAVLWEERQAPWENGVFTGPGSAVYKSTDGGTNWRQIMTGLPTYAADGVGRIGITVAPSLPSRLFATVDSRDKGGLYRSDDAGEHWHMVGTDARVTTRESDFAEVKVDPKNADVVYTASVVAWKSTDGGNTFSAWRGAPGGDDYHRLWINPNDPKTILLAGDQGGIITVNGGDTWSSWYNQPTAQMYHVIADNAFPYRVCSGQQDSGSVCVSSRGDDGAITIRDWHPVGLEEWGYAAPDPNDPDIIFGGKLTRYDRRTGQSHDVLPPQGPLASLGGADASRTLRTAPVLFSPIESRSLLFGANVIWKSITSGQTWTAISGDLSRAAWDAPANVGSYRSTPEARSARRGVVYTIAPSPIDAAILWAGTDDGLIHLTRDAGKTWTDVTPPQVTAWAKVSLMDASHFDVNSAYAAINTLRLDDVKPYIYRTRNGGKSWDRITRGIPDGTVVNVVREDPLRRGLLFAGTEENVYISFDDGESWQTLRLNMPAVSIRDLIIKDDDLVVGTHGRGFWILDDITPLRQITADVVARAQTYLFRPTTGWRFRWNKNTDTPWPADEPTMPNPPDGVPINYLITPGVTGPVTIEIVDPVGGTRPISAGGTGRVIRRFSSDDADEPLVPLADRNIPDRWIRPQLKPAAAPGLHRFIWDLRLPRPAADTFAYPISAISGYTPKEPRGALVLPGNYVVRLTVGGRVYAQGLLVKMDPRVKTPAADLALQFTLSRKITDLMQQLVDARKKGANAAVDAAYAPLTNLFNKLQDADVRPTAAVEAAANAAIAAAEAALAAIK